MALPLAIGVERTVKNGGLKLAILINLLSLSPALVSPHVLVLATVTGGTTAEKFKG